MGRGTTVAFVLVVTTLAAPLGAQEGTRPSPESTASRFSLGGALEAPAEFRLAAQPKLWLKDGVALVKKPLHWDGADFLKLAVVGAGIGLLMQQDESVDVWVQNRRSSSTDTFTRLVSPFGEWGALGVSAAALGGGLLFRDPELRDTGRDALEAALFAGGVVTPILKAAVGRTRPRDGTEEDQFRSFGGGSSFPSGHATTAFAVASVFAARSKGWVVPTVAYTLATSVAFARVHDRAHFLSDVAMGAVIGIVIGRGVVALHRRDEVDPSKEGLCVTLAPFGGASGGGIAARVSF